MFLGKCLRENQRGNRWTQGGEGGKEGGRRDQRETAGRREEKGKEGGRRRANSYKYNNQKKRRDYD